MEIIVSSEKIKKDLLKESEYIHNLKNIDSDKASTFMHIYLNPDLIKVK